MHVYMHVHAHVTTCCAWLNAVCMESEHTERFVAAIKGYVHSHACIHAYRYEWEIAEILAISADELQDVADSQLRKAELYAYIYKYKRAFIYYAILHSYSRTCGLTAAKDAVVPSHAGALPSIERTSPSQRSTPSRASRSP